MSSERLDSWRRSITAAVRLALSLALGFAVLAGALTLAWLAVTRPGLMVVAFAVGLWLLLLRQGSAAALAAALWHVGSRWRPGASDLRWVRRNPPDGW